MTLTDCYRSVCNGSCALTHVEHYGDCFAACVHELFAMLSDRGYETREDIERSEFRDDAAPVFAQASFSYRDAAAAPELPGVYGFTTRDGSCLYVGKAKNLKRRLLNYFHDTGESPRKLTLLYQDAVGLTVHVCGSELESLIYEYRLIRKHAPPLNTAVDIHERPGHWRPLADSIVVLPHAAPGTAMTFWFRTGKKILLKEYQGSGETDDLAEQIASFFFADTVPVSPTDFPEQEIAYRWIRRRQDHLPIVQIDRFESVEEIADAVRGLCREVCVSALPH
jgi:hypothetical protein